VRALIAIAAHAAGERQQRLAAAVDMVTLARPQNAMRSLIDEGPATDLLTIAFLAEAVMEIEDEALQDEINSRVEAWLTRRRG
jgi:hypothetical protein